MAFDHYCFLSHSIASTTSKYISGVEAVARIARKIQVIKEEEMNFLLDEWKMYKADEIPEKLLKKWIWIYSEEYQYKPFDDYWKEVIDPKRYFLKAENDSYQETPVSFPQDLLKSSFSLI